MITGQVLRMPRTDARFRVIETSAGGLRGIAAGERAGGRLLAIQEAHRYHARQVRDSGRPGTLLDTLTPHHPRYTLKPAAP